MTDLVFVYVTHPDADAALTLGRNLVEVGAAACVNVIPGMSSVYRWQGVVEDGREAVMIVKTRQDLVDSVTALVRAAHPYECPCIAALPVVAGDPPYLDWIAQSCRAD